MKRYGNKRGREENVVLLYYDRRAESRVIVEIQGKVSPEESKNESMQKTKKQARSGKQHDTKRKTHQGLDLPTCQTVQREITLHENGSVCSAKLARLDFKCFFEHIYRLVRFTQTRRFIAIAHPVMIGVLTGTLATLTSLQCEC